MSVFYEFVVCVSVVCVFVHRNACLYIWPDQSLQCYQSSNMTGHIVKCEHNSVWPSLPPLTAHLWQEYGGGDIRQCGKTRDTLGDMSEKFGTTTHWLSIQTVAVCRQYTTA